MLHNTLQLFITNRCNKRCKGCFYADMLSSEHMGFDLYKKLLNEYAKKLSATKVVLLGGEPTLHPQLRDFVAEAAGRGLLVTVYTNGANLQALDGCVGDGVAVRIGVLGHRRSEKPLAEIAPPGYPVSVVYMLRRDNLDELDATAADAEARFDCRYFMLSSIRDIAKTGSYWEDTPETLPNDEYKAETLRFLDRYRGGLDVHVANRGVFDGCGHDRCRFLNLYPDGSCTLCPFDISLGVKDDPENFGRRCRKHRECLLQKWVNNAPAHRP